MKKVTLLFLILGLSFALVSCSKKQNFNLDDNVDNINITKKENFGSSKVDLSINLTNDELDDFKELMNSITYVSSNGDSNKYEYIIRYDDVVINIISNEEFYIEKENEKNYYKVKNNDFSFLDDYDFINEQLFDISGFDFDHVYYVYNDLDLNISLNKEFIEDFSKTRLINIENDNYNTLISTVKFGDQIVKFVSETIVNINDKYYLMENRINVDFVNEDGLKSFDKLGEVEKIEVTKSSQTLEVPEKEIAVDSINNLEFIELNKAFNYNTKVEYTIKIDSIVFEVCNDYLLKYDSKLYYITFGNLDFLKDLKFNSTGWLPWV